MKLILPDTITWWKNNGVNEYGTPQFSTPVKIRGRWEDRSETSTDPDGRQIMTQSRIFLDRNVEIGDYLALGNHTNRVSPSNVLKANRVQKFMSTPDLRRTRVVRVAMT